MQNQRSKDLEIMRQARKVFVRHWIDLGRISLRSASGTIRVRGSLVRLPGYRDDLVPPVVEAIFKELERVKGGGRVIADLDNWNSEGGKWKVSEKTKDRKSSPGSPRQPSSGEGSTTTDIQDHI